MKFIQRIYIEQSISISSVNIGARFVNNQAFWTIKNQHSTPIWRKYVAYSSLSDTYQVLIDIGGDRCRHVLIIRAR